MSEKPRITPWNGFFRCDGSGVSGFGVTPTSAYAQWRAMLPGKVAMFVPKAPTLHDAAMLEALRAWEPTQAH